MKNKFIFILCIFLSFGFISCTESFSFCGYKVTNNSKKEIEIVFDNTSYKLPSMTSSILNYPASSVFYISKDYYVEYEERPYYSTTDKEEYIQIIINDIACFDYVIKNKTSSELTLTYYDVWFDKDKNISVSTNSEISFSVYKHQPLFTVYKDTEKVYFSSYTFENVHYIQVEDD